VEKEIETTARGNLCMPTSIMYHKEIIIISVQKSKKFGDFLKQKEKTFSKKR